MANLRRCAGLIGSLAIALSVPLLAQPIPPASIADKEIGWLKMYAFKAESEPLKVDTRVYTAAQRTIAVDLANWMQASYSPIGGWGMSCAPSLERVPRSRRVTASSGRSTLS